MFRTLKPGQWAVDISVAVLCLLLRWAMMGSAPHDGLPLAVVVLAMAAALGLRRASPALALGLAWMGALLQMAAVLPPDVANLAILPVLYCTAAYGSSKLRLVGFISAIVGALVASLYMILVTFALEFGATDSADAAMGIAANATVSILVTGSMLALLLLSWTVGLLGRTWRVARESKAAQARAEVEQQQAQRLVVIEQERTRIARDMHDVVAHSLAVVIAQADGARYARGVDPSAVDESLTTIAATAREALADVRVLLGQLRHSQHAGPQPSLGDLDRLIGQVRASGVNVTFEIRGVPQQAGTAVQLALYRIVQEALTNVLRHGDTARPVSVVLTWCVSSVRLELKNWVRTTVPRAVDATLHHGVVGMTERASLVGGWLTAEQVAAQFIVTTELPLEAHA